MSSAEDANPTSPSSASKPRRSSFAGETFSALFGGPNRRSSIAPSNNNNAGPDATLTTTSTSTTATPANPPPASTTAAARRPSPPLPNEGPITSAARRLSMTAFGALSGSSAGGNGAGGAAAIGHMRRESSLGSVAVGESAIEEDEVLSTSAPALGDVPSPTATGGESVGRNSFQSQQSPFSRRMSTSARALRDVRSGSGSGGPPGGSGGSPVREGFNWSENLRTRAERSSSIASSTLPSAQHLRNRSLASADSPPPAAAAQARPPPPVAPPAAQLERPKERPRPDHFQERILKGDFYMD